MTGKSGFQWQKNKRLPNNEMSSLVLLPIMFSKLRFCVSEVQLTFLLLPAVLHVVTESSGWTLQPEINDSGSWSLSAFGVDRHHKAGKAISVKLPEAPVLEV